MRRPFSPNRGRVLVASLGLLWTFSPCAADAARQRPTEYQVKAAFVLNFARFVEWPPDAAPPGSPLTICVLGRDPFHEALDAVTRGERVGGREIAVKRLNPRGDPSACQVLFVSRSERWRVSSVLQSVQGKSVLTVSDIDDFASHGGMIHFIKQNNRITFEINPQAAERARLRISSRLLSLGRIVQAPAPENGP
jgi:hypothetical protein